MEREREKINCPIAKLLLSTFMNKYLKNIDPNILRKMFQRNRNE